MSLLLSLCFFACSIVCWLHVKKIIEDKAVKGISLIPTFVFMITNVVEMVYFAERLDWWSVVGGASMLVSNVAWTICVFHYLRRERYDNTDIDWAIA